MKPAVILARKRAALRAALFFLLSCAGTIAFAPAFGAEAQPVASVVLGEPGTTTIRVLDCADGGVLAEATTASPLTTAVALAPDQQSAYATTETAQLLRLSLPDLQEQARTRLAFRANALAVSGGVDAIVLAGGAGSPMLSALDPRSLAALFEYHLPEAATIATIVDVPKRSRFAVGFSDLPEAWEIAYDRDAPPVLQGLVHDYRMREAVELPGRLTPRRFGLPGATRALVAGAVAHELLRIDTSGRAGVINLDVRREIERPLLDTLPSPARIRAWAGTSTRGWIFSNDGSSALRILESGSWRTAAPMTAPGEVLALTRDDGAVIVAFAQTGNTGIARLDVSVGAWKTLAQVSGHAARPLRFVDGSGDCIALVDRDGRWLAGLRRETRAAAPGRGS